MDIGHPTSKARETLVICFVSVGVNKNRHFFSEIKEQVKLSLTYFIFLKKC